MANEQTRGMTDFATQYSDGGGDVRDRARDAVQQVKDRAGERIESRISDSKSRAAETLSGVASSLKSSSQQLRDQQHEGASRAIERAAEGVERFASYLQETNVDDVVESVHEFARRQPAAFIGGAFALGFMASRFLKAPSPEGHGPRNLPAHTADTRYSTGYDTTRTYERGANAPRESGYGNTGDTSGTLGYGAGLSTRAGGTTGGGYDTTGGSDAGPR
ncbi:MAG TPA: hypothetical protein VGC44_09850 [Longimicrobiales bacterium]